MKHLYLAAIVLCITFFGSCDKDSLATQKPNGKVLAGVWELRAISGGPLVYNPNDYRPGNGSLWIFTETTFEQFYKDSLRRKGAYAVSRGAGIDLNTGRNIDQFIFNNEPAESFELRNDTLRFYFGSIPLDGVIEMFVKISD